MTVCVGLLLVLTIIAELDECHKLLNQKPVALATKSQATDIFLPLTHIDLSVNSVVVRLLEDVLQR